MAMLEHLPGVRIDPAPLRPPPISREVDDRALRFELERQACQSLRQVLQLKLQQRRSREELVGQGIMTHSMNFTAAKRLVGPEPSGSITPLLLPVGGTAARPIMRSAPPCTGAGRDHAGMALGMRERKTLWQSLKSSAVFHEQRRCLERARTEDYLKRKIRARPERSELIRMHILEETSAEPSLQAKQLQLKRARIADDLNDKISHRPGPMELIHKNILPVHSSIKQAIIETRFPKASGENSSCDEDSNCSLSPEQPLGLESPLGTLPSPPEVLAGSRSVASPTQVSPPALALPPLSGSSPQFKLTNGMAASSAQRTGATSQIKCHPKPHSDRSAQRHKKPKDNKPKIKKLKYHQYIPPDQKGDKEPPPHLDSSYAKILQQQQLFLQLQILSSVHPGRSPPSGFGCVPRDEAGVSTSQPG
ncbi:MKL/myocardin-like protein 1 [Liparis tanakae]|uniref:Phosphatase and actin regulator n=1 Tax=Liparis tanakae TaxID=230148 RepID=A0A4Z2GI29_9TELE|nr:MKL/myocardin-like protein 1 [Liparis tanakae]